MTDLHLIALLKQHGWKLHTRNSLRTWTKERLIDEIECLENNWGVSLEREEISFEYKKKLVQENEQLKAQNEKMKCCENCKHFMKDFESTIFTTLSCKVKNCNDNDNWELAEV